MLTKKTVRLTHPVMAFGNRYVEIILREPSGRIYFDLGPISANYRSGDVESATDLPGVLVSYLERCADNVPDAAVTMTVILAEIGLEDAMRLRRAMTSFFSDAVDRIIADDAPKTSANAAAQA